MGQGLRPSAQGVRVHVSGTDRTVTDGPFAETRELVAGFRIWEAASVEQAVEWVKRCPDPHEGPSDIEVRPLQTMEDSGEAVTPEIRAREQRIIKTLESR